MSSAKSIVISCAGIGSRLGLGQTKALIKINGKTIIAHLLELFKEVEDVRIVVGYEAQDVINEVLIYRDDVVFVFNHNYFETKTGASYYLGAQHANDYVIEIDGDLLIKPADMKKILDMEGEFLCFSKITSEDTIFVNINEDGYATGFSREKGNYEWTGPISMHKKNLRYSTENIYIQIEPNLPLRAIEVEAYDIDTYQDYLTVTQIVKNW